MKSKLVTIGGVQVHLAFDLLAWFEVEDEFESLDAMRKKLTSNARPVQTLVKLLTIEANAGERMTGGSTKYTAEWMRKHLKPGQVPEMTAAAYEAMAEAMKRDDSGHDEDVDVVAEELAKKRAADA